MPGTCDQIIILIKRKPGIPAVGVAIIRVNFCDLCDKISREPQCLFPAYRINSAAAVIHAHKLAECIDVPGIKLERLFY